jgi:hypothetical protein
MRRYVLLLACLGLVLTACGNEQPPTQVYIVVSPTPDDSLATVQALATAVASATNASLPTVMVVTAAPAITETVPPTLTSTTVPPTPIPSPATPPPTAAPDIFPTNVVAPVQIVEASFEHGRMFWIRHSRQIWVMENSPDDPNRGDWLCYNDTFEDGEQEIDPNLIPPEGLFQPRRGFGKLWRNYPEIRAALGWATTPEYELTSNYTYIAGGYVQGGQYFPGPGEHRMTTFDNDTISFYEGDIRGDCQGGTWRKATPQ